MSRSTSLLVLGLGNVLLADDGLGVAAVERLERRYRAPDGVRVLDGGTLGLSLLPHLQDARAAILVDAIRDDGAAPGAPVRIAGHEVRRAVQSRLSPHQVGVADLLDGVILRGEAPDPVILLGIVPESLDLDVGLTPAVAAGLDELVERIVEEARTLGFHFRSRTSDEPDDATPGSAARADPFGL
jgi:hydrogenase maturation protease